MLTNPITFCQEVGVGKRRAHLEAAAWFCCKLRYSWHQFQSLAVA